MEKKIMDVVEETTENVAEPVMAELAKEIDWAKYGKIACGVALATAGACVARKFVPKGVAKVKDILNNHADRKKIKKASEVITIDEYEVNDVSEDKNDK